MTDLTEHQHEYAIEILGQVLAGKRLDLMMDTVLKLKVAAIVRLDKRLSKLERKVR